MTSIAPEANCRSKIKVAPNGLGAYITSSDLHALKDHLFTYAQEAQIICSIHSFAKALLFNDKGRIQACCCVCGIFCIRHLWARQTIVNTGNIIIPVIFKFESLLQGL